MKHDWAPAILDMAHSWPGQPEISAFCQTFELKNRVWSLPYIPNFSPLAFISVAFIFWSSAVKIFKASWHQARRGRSKSTQEDGTTEHGSTGWTCKRFEILRDIERDVYVDKFFGRFRYCFHLEWTNTY